MSQLLLLSETPLSVTQVNRVARRAVEGELGALWIRGEIAEIKTYSSGHWYFTLKDAESQIRGVIWKTNAVRVGAPPAQGAQVFVFATPTIWQEKGEFRLTATEMLVTDRLGHQHLQFERVKAALQRDGLFDSARKRPLPVHPARIAVVTSLEGAALRDIMTVCWRRWPSLEVWVVGAKVQGAEAERELVRAFSVVNRLQGMDLCLVARGGGSRDDLAAFNSESVCRALAAVQVPTISAVGHETDISLTDLVADARAATPSAAVELAVPDRGEWTDRLNVLAERLAGALDQGTRLTVERLERTGDRLQVAMAQTVDRPRQRIERLAAQLDALSPLRVLERGFALPRGEDGHVLRRAVDFPPALAFRLRVVDGDIAARVEPKS